MKGFIDVEKRVALMPRAITGARIRFRSADEARDWIAKHWEELLRDPELLFSINCNDICMMCSHHRLSHRSSVCDSCPVERVRRLKRRIAALVRAGRAPSP